MKEYAVYVLVVIATLQLFLSYLSFGSLVEMRTLCLSMDATLEQIMPKNYYGDPT